MSSIVIEAMALEEVVAVVGVGAAVNIDCRLFRQLCIIADVTASTLITWSRIDSLAAVAHGSNSGTVAAGVQQTLTVDWPFYRISAAVGPARIARHI